MEKGREILDVLMGYRNEWVTQCVYCGRDIVNSRLMPAEFNPRFIGGDRDKVEFTIKGHKHLALRATADHYFDRCYGGHSVLNNIVPSCRPCNGTRSVGREWPICIDCLRNRALYDKRCGSCHHAFRLRSADIARVERLCSEIVNELIQISTFSRAYSLPQYIASSQSERL